MTYNILRKSFPLLILTDSHLMAGAPIFDVCVDPEIILKLQVSWVSRIATLTSCGCSCAC